MFPVIFYRVRLLSFFYSTWIHFLLPSYCPILLNFLRWSSILSNVGEWEEDDDFSNNHQGNVEIPATGTAYGLNENQSQTRGQGPGHAEGQGAHGNHGHGHSGQKGLQHGLGDWRNSIFTLFVSARSIETFFIFLHETRFFLSSTLVFLEFREVHESYSKLIF